MNTSTSFAQSLTRALTDRGQWLGGWRPNDGPQTAFLHCPAFECLYGGAAGGGKTAALIHDPLRDIGRSKYAALLLRRSFPELEKTIIAESHATYPKLGGRYRGDSKTWTFPSGARIMFGYLDSDRDVYQYQGAEFQYVGFDELTHFTRFQYVYLISRLRSSHGIECRLRATTNPGGDGHEWVFERWARWLDPASPVRADSGAVARYDNTEAGEKWHEGGKFSRTFIAASLRDTPQLRDTGYGDQLLALDAVQRAQLLDGNWLVKPARGLYFKRHWFGVDDAAPAQAMRVRYWDRAATEDGDWTVGLRLARDATGRFWIEDVIRFRGRPAEVEQVVVDTAAADGRGVQVGIEQDPGQSGKFEASYYVRRLAGWHVRTYPVTKAKIVRAQPASAQCEAGNVRLVRGPWNKALLDELEAFPEGVHDDQVDALSGAFAAILTTPTVDRSFRNLPFQ